MGFSFPSGSITVTGGGVGGVSSVNGQTGDVIINIPDDSGGGADGSSTGNRLLTGGSVAHTEDLTVTVGAATYSIQDVEYDSPQTELTAAVADGANPRIDVIALNTSGEAVIITGTPAASPVKPDVNPLTQLELTFIVVDAAATVIEVNVEDIYRENAEWTMTESGGHFALADLTNPNTGTKAIKATAAVSNDYFQAEAPAPFEIEDYDNLVLLVESVTWANSKQINLTVRNAGVAKGTPVVLKDGSFAFNRLAVGAYQQVVIPTSLFGASGIEIDQLRGTVAGGGGAMTFFIDDITLQGGLSQQTDSSRMRFRGSWATDKFYNKNDTVLHSDDIQYVARRANTGRNPTSNPDDWEASTSAGGGGTVTVTGTPTGGQLAEWTSATDIQGKALGTGVSTALGVNVGSAGAVVVNGGAGGTPASINLTNATAVPAGQISGVIPIANLATGTPDGSKFIRDDGTLQTIAGGGDMLLGTAQTVTAAKTFNDTTLRTASGGRLADANGHELIKFPASVTSPVNEITISNAPTGTGPLIQASGDDSVIPIRIKGKGAAGRIFLYGSGDGEHTSTALDNVGTGLMSTLLWNMNGVNKAILGVGPANNVITGAAEGDMCYRVAAGLYHRFSADGGNNSAFIITPLTSYVNGVTISPNTTGNRPKILAHGSDSVISLQIQSKGTASDIRLVGGGDGDHTFTHLDSIGSGLMTRLGFKQNGTTMSYMGVGAANALLTGCSDGDLVTLTISKNMWWGTGGDVPALKIDTSNTVSAEQTTASTSTTTGALRSKGGLGVAGRINCGDSVTTGAPSGGTAGSWKLGIRVADTVAFDTSQYIQLDVGGTLYKVAIAV